MKNYILVGDIGGTNTRLALCNIHTGKISAIHIYTVKNHENIENIISNYINNQKNKIKKACIAIACPVTKDKISMTNHTWEFSIKKMKFNLKLEQLEIINDFTAIAMSIPVLKKKDIIQFGGKKPIQGKPIVIYGAGTGLGVSHLIKINKNWVNLPGEGGHVDFASNSKEEDNILSVLREELGHVSAEKILSGPGLVNLYKAIVKSKGKIPKNLLPKQITKKAIKKTCPYSQKTLSLFCTLMGSFGGNLALNMGTFGGVYIAGGIIPKFLKFFFKSNFRYAFEDKGRFKEYLKNIPVYLIKHKQPGLLGAGTYIRQNMGYKI
ncbi:MAG: glucokinase [Candidatus Westeberhardia cardiocondylae]|nr:glucokinase [Candidatus Westeberhardia cardiocondylae]